MAFYIISYDLNDGDREDYAELYDAIAALGQSAWPLKSTWVIASEETDATICRHLAGFVGPDDKLFVAEIALAPSGDPAYSSENIDDEDMDNLEAVRNSSWWSQE